MKRRSRIEIGSEIYLRSRMPLLGINHPVTVSSPRLFTLEQINSGLARQLNELWHSRLPLYGGITTIAYGILFEECWYGVALWSNPVARLLPQKTCMELRRMALSPECPRNTASWMLSRMEKDIIIRFPHIEKLISYQDTEVHQGTIYKASNWIPESETKGDSQWSRPSRWRLETQAKGNKVRWAKSLTHNNKIYPVPMP